MFKKTMMDLSDFIEPLQTPVTAKQKRTSQKYYGLDGLKIRQVKSQSKKIINNLVISTAGTSPFNSLGPEKTKSTEIGDNSFEVTTIKYYETREGIR